MEAVDPEPLTSVAVQRHQDSLRSSPLWIVAAGKAAWPMARAATRTLSPVATLIAGPRDPEANLDGVQHMEAEHPIPGHNSMMAARRALEMATAARASNGRVLVLLSGGASAMLCAPVAALSLEEKGATTVALMRAGADIGALNSVRKHLSTIKGGRLAAAARRCVTLAISDVHAPEDDPATIGSGPTVADPTTYADALHAIARCGCDVPPPVLDHLRRGQQHLVEETIKPGDPRLADTCYEVIANRHTAVLAGAAEARRLGYQVRVIDTPTRGEARDAGRLFAELALATEPLAGPACVIGSGEPTVVVRGGGRGGRNQEFALGAAKVLVGHPDALLVSIGTDGIDGPTDAAGAVVSSSTVAEVQARGLDIDKALANNDAYPLLAATDDLIIWGPTFTNVGDLHIVITMRA